MTRNDFAADKMSLSGIYSSRQEIVRQLLHKNDLAALLLTTAESIYYLCGLNHQGNYSVTYLLVTPDRPAVLVVKSFDHVTAADQTYGVSLRTYAPKEHPGQVLAEVIKAASAEDGRIGCEKELMFCPPALLDVCENLLPSVTFVDETGLVEDVRMVKSSLELNYMRRSARLGDLAIKALSEAAVPGAKEGELAAVAYETMLRNGSEFPAMAPMIRSGCRLPWTEATWTDRELKSGDVLLVELAASVERYHAPIGRTIRIDDPGSHETGIIAHHARDAQLEALRPGNTFADVFNAWHNALAEKDVVVEIDNRDLVFFVGYVIGIAFPPSWVGGRIVPLCADNKRILQEGMTFILITWTDPEGWTDFRTDSVVVTPNGGELLSH